MKKIVLKLISFVFLITLFFSFNYGYCDDFTSQRDINDPYKPWVIEFNQPYDYEYLMKQVESNSNPIRINYIHEDYTYTLPIELDKESDYKLKVIPRIGYLYNTEYKLSINGQGVRSISGIYLYDYISLPFKLVGQPIPVNFEDGVLEDIVREIINKKFDPIYKEDLEGIWTITDDSSKGEIHSLKGIEYLYNLKTLDLTNSKVRDVGPLSELKNLSSLSLNSYYLKDHRQISDLHYLDKLQLTNVSSLVDFSFLEGIPTLKSLSIVKSDIDDYSFLYPIENLNSLSLIDNQLKDISFIERLDNLEGLDLSHNAIEDIRPLSSLTNLRSLDLDYNIISSLAPLKKLTNLNTLNADYNFIENLEGLENCETLERISLYENNVKDLSSLSNLSNIQLLNLGNNIISDISILGNLEELHDVELYGNPITDISPIVDKPLIFGTLLSLDKIQEAGIKAHEIIDEIIEEDMTDLEKEEAIYRYIIDNIEYYYNMEDPRGIYGALIHESAICEGYAHAMKVLGRLAGLDCMYIVGEVGLTGMHSWNMINLDGKYYHIDTSQDYTCNRLPQDPSSFNMLDFDMMNEGQRIWSIDYPKTKEIDNNYILPFLSRVF